MIKSYRIIAAQLLLLGCAGNLPRGEAATQTKGISKVVIHLNQLEAAKLQFKGGADKDLDVERAFVPVGGRLYVEDHKSGACRSEDCSDFADKALQIMSIKIQLKAGNRIDCLVSGEKRHRIDFMRKSSFLVCDINSDPGDEFEVQLLNADDIMVGAFKVNRAD